MVRIIFVIVALLVVAVAVLLIYAAKQPDDFRIARATVVRAPPEKIYPLISDLRSFNEWNPFARDDPSLKITYGARSAGTGGSYAWDSKGRTGQGRMEISDTVAPSSVTMQLFFTRPMEAHNVVVFQLRRQGEVTEVSWTMTGTNALINKAMGIVFNMDKMVGGEFEKGLAALKGLAER